MKSKSILATIVICSIVPAIVNAATSSVITITFDPPSLPGGDKALQSYTEKGINFTGRLDRSFSHTDAGLSGRPNNGTAFLNVTRFYAQFKPTVSVLFDLVKVDLAEYSTVYASPQTITFRGYRYDSSTVVATFVTDGVIDGTGPLKDFETFTFSDSFRCLSYVEIKSAGFAMDNMQIRLPSEPSTPPIADADGPYTINVGDTLILDASGSTDDDNDIVSYMWDLDYDENFETDAGGQAVFDVNYADLQSLGLLVDHTYNIYLKVTDSECQSDVNYSTLTIVPKPAVKVAVDIKPGSCPNPVNVKSSGVLPIAILGTDDYDVTTIDPTSIRLAGVEPIRSGYEDVAAPVSDSNDCNCITDGPDGFLDLTLKFKTQRIVEAVGDVNDGDELQLELIGVLFDEIPIEGADCILIRGRHKPINRADINKDGVVNAADFAIIAENWLQSSIVQD